MQVYNLIICEYFCLGSIDFLLKGKRLLDDTNLFSPNHYDKNEKVILNIFNTKKMKKLYYIICGKNIKL